MSTSVDRKTGLPQSVRVRLSQLMIIPKDDLPGRKLKMHLDFIYSEEHSILYSLDFMEVHSPFHCSFYRNFHVELNEPNFCPRFCQQLLKYMFSKTCILELIHILDVILSLLSVSGENFCRQSHGKVDELLQSPSCAKLSPRKTKNQDHSSKSNFLCLPVLVFCGIELIFFIVACMMLCFGCVIKTVLVTHQCFQLLLS